MQFPEHRPQNPRKAEKNLFHRNMGSGVLESCEDPEAGWYHEMSYHEKETIMIVGIYGIFLGNRILPGFLRWREMDLSKLGFPVLIAGLEPGGLRVVLD